MEMLVSQPNNRALVDAIKAQLRYAGFGEVTETYAAGEIRVGVEADEGQREEFEQNVRMLDPAARRFG